MLKDERMQRQLRQARLQEVRRQESLLAERTAETYNAQRLEAERLAEEQEAVNPNQHRLYNEKLAQRETLLRQKQAFMESMGRAQEAAQENELRDLQARQAKEASLRQAWERAQARGEVAIHRESEERAARLRQEQFLRECRQEVLLAEAQRAHDRAQRFREEQIALMRRKEAESNYIPPGGEFRAGPIDYSQTHFHNPVLVQRHDPAGPSALDLAQEELRRRSEQKEGEAMRRENQQQMAAERGAKALTAELLKREQESLLKELKAITAADAGLKITAGQTDPILYSRTTALAEQQDTSKRQALEADYEQLLLKHQPPKQQPRAWQTTQTPAIPPQQEQPQLNVVEVPLAREEQADQQPDKKVILINEGSRNDPFKLESRKKQGARTDIKREQEESRKRPVEKGIRTEVKREEEVRKRETALKPSLKMPVKKAWQPPEDSESEESEESARHYSSEESEEEEQVKLPSKAIYTAHDLAKDITTRPYQSAHTAVPVSTYKRAASPQTKDLSSSSSSVEAPAKPSPRYNRYKEEYEDSQSSKDSHPQLSEGEESPVDPAEDIIAKYLTKKPYEELKREEDSDKGAEEESSEEEEAPRRQTTKAPASVHFPRDTKPSQPYTSALSPSDLSSSSPQVYPVPYMYPVYQPVPMFPTYYPPPYAPAPTASIGSFGQSLQFSQSSNSSAFTPQSSTKKHAAEPQKRSPIKTDDTPDSSLEGPLASKYTAAGEAVKPKKRAAGELGLYSAFKAELGKKADFTPTLGHSSEMLSAEEPVSSAHLQASKFTEEDKLSELDFIESHRSNSKPSGGEIVQVESDSTPLSQAFIQRKQALVARMSNRAETQKEPSRQHEKTKEELLAIRKEMLKGKTLPKAKTEDLDSSEEAKKAGNSALMQRLASGSKARVNKKEMLQLTAKNYQQLPEVRQRREEEEKKEALRKRLTTAKEYEMRRKGKGK